MILVALLLALLTPAVCLPAASSSDAAPKQSNVRTLQEMCAEAVEHDLLYNPSHNAVAPHFECLKNNINLATKPLILSVLNKALIDRIGWQDREFVTGDWSSQRAEQDEKTACRGTWAETSNYTGLMYNQKCTLVRAPGFGAYPPVFYVYPSHIHGNGKQQTREGRTSPISKVALKYVYLSVNNKYLIATVTNAEGNQHKKILYPAKTPCFSPDGQRLAHMYNDGSICITDVDTDRCVKLDVKLAQAVENKSHYPELSWSPDGAWLMCKKIRLQQNRHNDNYDKKTVIIWNSTTGKCCSAIATEETRIFFARDNNDLLRYSGGFFKNPHRLWSIYRSCIDTLHTLAQLDQLSPESCGYAELTQKYPDCANKALFPFLLTALQKSWRYNKPHSVMAEDTERLTALHTVAQSMKNENLFKARHNASQ